MPKLSARVLSTERQIQYAKSRGDRTEYRISSARNLVLVVRPTGSKAWYFRFVSPITRKHRKMRIGEYPTMGLAAARDRMVQLSASVNSGRDPLLQQNLEGEADSFERLAHLYMEGRQDRRPDGRSSAWQREVKRLLDRDILPFLRNHRAKLVLKSDVVGVVQRVTQRRSFGIADKTLGVIRAIYGWGIETGRVESDPTRALKKIGTGRPRERVLSDAELRTFWNALNEQSGLSPAIRDALQLLLGVRIAEATGALKAELDFDKRIWTIAAERNKSGRTHVIPLTEFAVGILRSASDRARDSKWVFPAASKLHAVRSKSASRAMLRLSGEIGIAGLRTHDLRRTCATGLGNLNIADEVIERILNHAPRTVTRRHYNHAAQLAAVRGALDQWDDSVAALVGREQAGTAEAA